MPAKRILLVDDERDVADMLSRVLRGDGYDVEMVDTATRAFVALRVPRHDLLITDYRLPDGKRVGGGRQSGERGHQDADYQRLPFHDPGAPGACP